MQLLQHRGKYDWTHVGAKSQTSRQFLATLKSVKHDWSRGNKSNMKFVNMFRLSFFVLCVCIPAGNQFKFKICEIYRTASKLRNPGKLPRKGWENPGTVLRNNEPSG